MRLRPSVLMAAVMGDEFEINRICPPIVPSLGAEVVGNGTFEGTFTGGLANGWSLYSTPTPSESSDAHGGAKAQQITCAADNQGVAQNLSVVSGGWYMGSFWGKEVSGNGFIRSDIASGWFGGDVNSTSWTQILRTFRATAASISLNLRSAGSSSPFLVFIVDDISFVPLTNTTVYLGMRASKNGTYICHPIVTDGTQAGIDICYKDSTNFVRAIVERGPSTDAGKLLKLIGGTWTEVITGDITYSAGAELKVIISGNTYQLFYNNVQVGSDGTISDSGLGTGVYGFSAYVNNLVGIVTTNP